MSSAVAEAQQRLVDQLIALGDLWSQPLIQAFRTTPRHMFLTRIYEYQRAGGWQEIALDVLGPRELALVYSDRVLTTRLSEPSGQASGVAISSSSQPSLMAQMLEDLHLMPGQRVLEIGVDFAKFDARIPAGHPSPRAQLRQNGRRAADRHREADVARSRADRRIDADHLAA